MFTSIKTPQAFLKSITDMFESIPKTPQDAKVVFEKVQAVATTEFKNALEMNRVYQKAMTGDATPKEIATANENAKELLKATSFAALVAIPGALFVLPTIIGQAKEYDLDLVPKTVAAEFNI
jgi:hypothetical protein